MQKPLTVTCAVMITGGALFIAKRPWGSHLSGMWELPGGKAEAGESPRECLSRELREELNIHVKPGNLEYFDEVFYEYGNMRLRLVGFTVGAYSGKVQLNEHTDACWAPIKSLETFQFAPADIPIIRRIRKALP